MSREAMKLALEALEWCHGGEPCGTAEAITALREALANEALDKMAENARELGLDYEPAQQEPVAKHYVDGGHLVYPKAQRTWVGLTDDELADFWFKQSLDWMEFARVIEDALRSKNT